MIKIIKMLYSSFEKHISKSIWRMMIITFSIVLLLPIAFIIPVLSQDTWKPVTQESYDTQRLLAESLVAPIELYVSTQKKDLKSFVKFSLGDLDASLNVNSVLKEYVETNNDIISISLMNYRDSSLHTVSSFSSEKTSKSSLEQNANLQSMKFSESTLSYIISEVKYRRYDQDETVSEAFKSTFSSTPALLIRQHLFDENKDKSGTLFIELSLNYIQKLCSDIRFGENGQCLIVDDKRQIIASENQQWVSGLKKIFGEEVLSQSRSSNSGAFEYESKLFKEDLIAGFAKIDFLDWTAIVARPAKELEGLSKDFIKTIVFWGVVGLLISMLTVWRMSYVIIRPLRSLVTKSTELGSRGGTFNLGEVPENSPYEISILWTTISNLFQNFQEVDEKANKLTKKSNQDVRKIVVDFRMKNLQKKENIDPFLGITSFESFKQELERALIVNEAQKVGLIIFKMKSLKELITVWDKKIISRFLQHTGRTLQSHIRGSDMVAKHGDQVGEFILYINHLENDETLEFIAQKLFFVLKNNPFKENDTEIVAKISMRNVTHKVTKLSNTEQVIADVENAFYKSQSSSHS